MIMRHPVNSELPAAYQYEITVLGYYALFYNGLWVTTCSDLVDIVAAAYGHQAAIEEEK